MPFHTIVDFSFTGFVSDSLDYLLAHPLALACVVAGAFLIVVELCFLIAKHSAKRTVADKAQNRVISIDVAREKLLDTIARNHRRDDGGRVA